MNPKQMFKVQEQLDKKKQMEKDLLQRLLKNKEQQKNLAFKLHHLKYHQPIL